MFEIDGDLFMLVASNFRTLYPGGHELEQYLYKFDATLNGMGKRQYINKPSGEFRPVSFSSEKTVPKHGYYNYMDWKHIHIESSDQHFLAVAQHWGPKEASMPGLAGNYPAQGFITNSYIYEWNHDSKAFVERQSIITKGAEAFESWSHEGNTYLMVSNTFDNSKSHFKDTNNPNNKMMTYNHDDCYKFDTATNKFLPVFKILSHYAMGYKSLLLNGRVFLVNAVRKRFWDANTYVWNVNEGYYSNDEVLDSIIYEVGKTNPVGFSITKDHKLPIKQPMGIAVFEMEAKRYMVAGSRWDYYSITSGSQGHKRFNTQADYQSKIWRYDDPKSSPVLIQSLIQEGINSDWQYFSMDAKHYLVCVSSMTVENNGHVPTIIYEYNTVSKQFEEYQRLTILYGWVAQVIQFDGRTLLAIGTGYSDTQYFKSPIYEKCAATGKFKLFQLIPSRQAHALHSFKLDGEQMLAIGNDYCANSAESLTLNDPLRACMTLHIFDKPTNKYKEFQRFASSSDQGFGVRDVEYAYVNGNDFLFVASQSGYVLNAGSFVYIRNKNTGFFDLHQTIYGSTAQDFESWSIGSR